MTQKPKKKLGKVYWFTGLSGVGKTTIGNEFYKRLQNPAVHKNNPGILWLDGDQLREIFDSELGYSREDRFQVAMRNSRLCKWVSDQGIDIVCATVSLFYQCQEWNRKNIHNYKEIYLVSSWETLMARDQKQLYSRAFSGKLKNVWGVDLIAQTPKNPDLIIQNDGTESPENIAERIFQELFP